MSRVEIISAKDLTAELRDEWLAMRADNPRLYSPYFHPDYSVLVGQLRDDARIAIMFDASKPVAFLPYQGPHPGRNGFARPIGAPMTDYHGVIHRPEHKPDAMKLLRDAGIGAFQYSAMVDDVSSLSGVTFASEQTALVEFPEGSEAWRKEQGSSYRRHLKSHRRRVRKAETDFGARSFDFCSKDQAVYDRLMTLKREKFSESGKYDVLSNDWTSQLLETLWQRGHEGSSDLRCDLHVLSFDGRPVAMDLGLSDGVTFHSWMVAYEPDYHSVAPGIQLLEGLIDEADALGYEKIDLGAGKDGYKRHYATTEYVVHGGYIPVQGPAATLARLYGMTERFGQKRLKDAPGKLRRRYSQIAACDETLSGRAKAMYSALINFKRSA